MTYVETYLSSDLIIEDRRVDVVVDISSQLPFAEESLDTVFCCSVLEHVPRPWEALSEMRRILVQGGTLIISLPFILHLHDQPHDYYRFSIYEACTFKRSARASLTIADDLLLLFLEYYSRRAVLGAEYHSVT